MGRVLLQASLLCPVPQSLDFVVVYGSLNEKWPFLISGAGPKAGALAVAV